MIEWGFGPIFLIWSIGMIFSIEQLFSDKQAITADTDSDNVIDLGAAGTPYRAFKPLNQDIGKGSKVSLLVQVTEAFNNLDDLEIVVATGMTPLVLDNIIASETILLVDLIIGKQFVLDVLPNGIVQRYLGIQYVVNGAAPNAGSVTAGITMGNQTNITGA